LHIHLCNAPLSFSFSLTNEAKIENLIINANYSTNLYNSITHQVEINSNRIETSHSVSLENQAQLNNETTPKRNKSINSETKPRLINNTIAKRDRRYKYPFKDKLLLLISILSLISIPESLSWETMNPEFNDSLNLGSPLLGKTSDNFNFLTPNPPKVKSPQSQSALQELISKTKNSSAFKRELKKLRSITATRNLTGVEEVRLAELTRKEEEARLKEKSKVKRNRKNAKSAQVTTSDTRVSDSEASIDSSTLDQEILKSFFDPSPFLDNNFDLGTDILAVAADSIARSHLVVITDGASQEQATNSDSNKGANSLTHSQSQTATSISQNVAANSTIDLDSETPPIGTLESQRLSSNCFRPPKKSSSFSQFQKTMSSRTNQYRNQNS